MRVVDQGMRRHTLFVLGGLALALSCTDKDTTGGDTGTTAPAGPCADGGWGAIADPEGAVHVRADGSDDGDGSVDAPVATLDAGLALSRAGGTRPIAVGPGTFDAALVLTDDSGDGASDDGLVLQGCGSAETVLTGDATDSLIRGVDVQDLVLAGLGFDGGRRTLWLRAGTTAVVDDLALTGATRLGLVIDGSSTLVDATALTIADTVAETLSSGASMGYGVSVDGGTLALRDSTISGSTGVGILATFANLELDGVTVSDTLAGDDGTLGRGVQLQELSQGVLTSVTLTDHVDAALFATRAVDLQVQDLVITTVAAGVVPGHSDTTGDGLVVTQGADGDSDPADFTASLHGVSIASTDRAAVVLDGVTADLDDHTHTDNGLVIDGSSTLTQGDTVVTGSVASASLDADSELALNHQVVELDDYLD